MTHKFIALEIIKTVAWISILFIYKCFYLTRRSDLDESA
jgi:hypothetical protein